MKKRAYIKNQIIGIKKTKARFLSIFVIVFLGSAFYAGLRHAPTIMENSIEEYLIDYGFEDIDIIATLGFSQKDISYLDDIEEIDEYQVGLRYDALLSFQGTDFGVIVYTQDDFSSSVNQAVLLSGDYPESDNECLIDNEFAVDQGLGVGDVISLTSAYDDKIYVISGIAQDTRYMSIVERGTNSLGDGSNSAYVMMYTVGNESMALPDDLYELREEEVLYNDIRITLKNEEGYSLFSEEYDTYVRSVSYEINNIYHQLFDDLYSEMMDEYTTLYEEGYQEYLEGYEEYVVGYATFETEMASAKLQIIEAKKELIENEQLLLEAQISMQDSLEEIPDEIAKLQENLAILQDELNITREQLEQQDYQDVDLESYLSTLDEQLTDIQVELGTLEGTTSDLLAYNEASLLLEEASLDIQIAENELLIQEIELEQEFTEAKTALEEANVQLEEAKEELDSIPEGTIITLTNNENGGFVTFEANAASIESISFIFPLLFFLVAALVSLTTMTRMIEEQRLQSGTLLALGYSKQDVLMQYVGYALLATLFASVLGILFGVAFFPWIIYFLYTSILYGVQAPIQISFDAIVCMQTIFIAVIITLVVTVYVCYGELMDLPATLLRPKAPKSGKRILLERIPFIWKRLSFNRKVTMRNIFRYKKRFIMSVIGIAGCSALIVTGFGLRDSIAQVVTVQFGDIWHFDATISYSESVGQQDVDELEELLIEQGSISAINSVYSQTTLFAGETKDYAGYVVVPENSTDFSDFVSVIDKDSEEELLLEDDGVIINEKLAELLDVEVNDTISVTFDNSTYVVKVSGICQHHFMHYMYMSKTYYESLTSSDVKYNNAYVMTTSTTQSTLDSLGERLMELDEVSGTTFMSTTSETFQTQLQSVNSVVVILVVCAGCLAFVVLYNLTNINIQERKSEIATIKVLGFYKKEVDDYVFRENMLLSFIGAIVGCVLGKLIHMYLMPTIEIEMTMFVREISYSTYLVAIALTMIFTFIINHKMSKVIKKIDMVESLKSVE
ncbi:FtsX-like permease family protein [Tannockella kyphosi]|uniref:FtsX-like permease family protein n=1 Tax=Tannockella kyphosi TaxID=2899121 RepID=UPI0020121319|nr:FtsX-like permease family protein [Tannockella kyphosi]